MTRLSVIIPSYKDPLLVKTIGSLLTNSELGDELEIVTDMEPTSGGYVYLLTNKTNGKRYVGQTTQQVERRWSQHICDAKRHGKKYPLHRAINKYGKDGFEISVLAKACSIDGLNILERFFIGRLRTIVPFGYNLLSGGRNGGKLPETTRKKISIACTGKPGVPHTEEFKERLRERSLGNKYSLGRKQSKEEREKHRIISTRYKRGANGQFVKER